MSGNIHGFDFVIDRDYFPSIGEYLLVCKDDFTRVNHDQDKLPIQEPTDTNSMRKKTYKIS